MTDTYAVIGSKQQATLLAEASYPNVLVSFAIDPAAELIDALGYRPRSVLLDSGAFTAWTTGKPVDPDALIEWVRGYRQRYPDAAVLNLDVIPGTPTVRPTRAEMEHAIAASADNAERLRDAGLAVIEVWHLYEPLDVLDAIMARRRPGERIAFGGLARWRGGPHVSVKQRFCASGFRHLRTDDGTIPAVHGLGVSPDSVGLGAHRYPWASVDSTSWCSMGQYGVRVTRNGKRWGGRSDPRAGNPGIARVYSLRVLALWADASRYDDLWRARGVTIT